MILDIEVHTQTLDGYASLFWRFMSDKRGCIRALANLYVKEYQWRYNHRDEDL